MTNIKVQIIYENLENHKLKNYLEWGNLMCNIHLDDHR